MFVPGTIVVLSLVRCVIHFRRTCLSIILHRGSLRNSSERCVFSVAAFLCCVLQAVVLRYSSDHPRSLMLLPAMIVLGGQILGWEAVDMETVMHVSTPRWRRCVIRPLQRSDNRASFLALQQCPHTADCRGTRRRVLEISSRPCRRSSAWRYFAVLFLVWPLSRDARLQMVGWAAIAPVAAIFAYCSVHATRAAVAAFRKQPAHPSVAARAQ